MVAAVAAVLVATGAVACKPVPTAPGTDRVVVLGDSVPAWLFRDGAPAGVDAERFTAINGTLEACEGAAGNPPARGRSGDVVPTPTACDKGWSGLYPPHLTLETDVAVLMAGNHAMLDHKLSGTWRHPCHAPFRDWYRTDLTNRLDYLDTKAERVVLVLPAWPGPNSGWIMPADHEKRADCVRGVMRQAADATGATVVDLGAYLCPGGASSCNSWRSGDGIHVDTARAATVLAWLLDAADPTAV